MRNNALIKEWYWKDLFLYHKRLSGKLLIYSPQENTLPQMTLDQVHIPIGYNPEEYLEERTSLSTNAASIRMKRKNSGEVCEQHKSEYDTVCDVTIDWI